MVPVSARCGAMDGIIGEAATAGAGGRSIEARGITGGWVSAATEAW
jgi:hypothetical protein